VISGDSANDLTHMALDPNVHIQEVKAFTCGIRPGRRPRGPELPRFVAELRDQAHSRREQDPRTEPEEVRDTSS
jgi:formate dehydrogenase major subunit